MNGNDYVKKPVVIQAIHYTGYNVEEALSFSDGKARKSASIPSDNGKIYLVIETLEGAHLCGPGDWIIKGIKGEFYPCKPDIFDATYEALEKAAAEDLAKTILPCDRDPVRMNEVMKDQKKGIEWIEQRADQLLHRWAEESGNSEMAWPRANEIAHEFADLENDFNYIKDLNTSMAVRYEEIWDCLPSLTEIDALLNIVTYGTPDTDAKFFCTAKKEDRVKKLKKLRSAIAHSEGNL